MASNTFDFHKFARDYQITSCINGLADVLSSVADHELNERIEKFKNEFKLKNGADPKPDFRFRITHDTYEQVLRDCSRRRIDLRRCTFIQGNRYFVERNYRIQGNQSYKEVAWPSSVDFQQEAAQLAFLDREKKHVDWPLTLNNLNDMIRDKPYSENMMKACLLRFINNYEPTQTEYLKGKTCNQIANFLLSLNLRIDRKAFHMDRLLASERSPAETLSSAIAKLKNIAEFIYPTEIVDNDDLSDYESINNDEDTKVNSSVNQILINGIISFVRDELAVPLMDKINDDELMNKSLDYTFYLKLAMLAEQRSRLYPTKILKYGRKITELEITFHNFEIPVIHPCQRLYRRRNLDLNNYFGHLALADDNIGADGDRLERNGPLLPYHIPNLSPPINHHYESINSDQSNPSTSSLSLAEGKDKGTKSEQKTAKSESKDNEKTKDNRSDSSYDDEHIYEEINTMITLMKKYNIKPQLKDNVSDESKLKKSDQDYHRSDNNFSDKGYSDNHDGYLNRHQPRQNYNDDRKSYPNRDRDYHYPYEPDDRRYSDRNRGYNDHVDSHDDHYPDKSRDYHGHPQERGRTHQRSPFQDNKSRIEINRDRFLESRRAELMDPYPLMKKGINCSPTYDPYVERYCSKCPKYDNHHEFECQRYSSWNDVKCGLCRLYNHISIECTEPHPN